MKRIFCVLLLALATVVVGASPVSAAPAAGGTTGTLSGDASCAFNLTVTWKNQKVAHVYAGWYYDRGTDANGLPTGFVFTTEAPGVGPNGGTLKGKTAIMTAGPATVTTTAHNWDVLVMPYDAQGAALPQVWSNTLNLGCSLG